MIPNVHDRATAEQFVKACVAEIGLGFHPDTRFEDYVDAGGNRVFSDAEAALRPADATPAAGSCEHCPGHGGGCIVCDGIQAKPEGGR